MNSNTPPLLPTHLTPSGLATLFTLVTILVSWGALYLPWQSAIPWETYLPEALRITVYDDTGQQMAHRIALGMIAVFSVIGVYLGRKNQLHYHGPIARGLSLGFGYLRGYAWIGVVLVVILAAVENPRGGENLLAVLRALNPTYIAAGVLILWLLLAVTDRIPPLARRLLWVVFLLYCLYLLLPGLIVTPNYARMDPEIFSFFERHHAHVTYPTLLFAQEGMHAFEDFLPAYGVLTPTLAAIWQRLSGAFSFGDFLQFVQLTQVAFFLMMVAAYRIWVPDRPLMLVGMTLLMLPWLASFSVAVIAPNLSAWRFLGIAIVPLLLLSVRHFSFVRAAVAVGIGSGIALLINFETGLCLSAGMLVYLGVRMNPFSWGRLGWLMALFVAGFFVATGFYVLLFRGGFGYWPSLIPVGDLFAPVMTQSSGAPGLPFRLEPLPLVIFIHTAFVVIRSAMTWRMQTLPFRPAFKLAIAIIILSWFAYYVHLPTRENIWTLMVLYLFFIPGYMDLGRLRRWRGCWKPGQWRVIPISVMVLILILTPMALRMNLKAVKKLWSDLSVSAEGSTIGLEKVSGIWLTREMGMRLKEKGAYVRAMAPSGNFLMFTSHAYLISLLSDYVPRFPTYDFFFSIKRHKDLDWFTHEVLTRAPKRLLFDEDILHPHDPEWRRDERQVFKEQALLHRLQNRLKEHYHPIVVDSGWEIWARYDP
uniref:4-amino-4-deoxy-L-arabinose transferase n=1 Tax=Candidatus Kentrum sp. MB TaxID=2138164 RepID=A0A450X211_9GAMM|nr:MAG: hypothetical protein BECKMB1821G_GA0114241_100472 [Candidatus Kentron sp. MB]